MRESSTSWKAKEEKPEGWNTGLLLDLERQLENDPERWSEREPDERAKKSQREPKRARESL